MSQQATLTDSAYPTKIFRFNSGISTGVQFPFVLPSVRAFTSLPGCVRTFGQIFKRGVSPRRSMGVLLFQ
jgi:hypothetical protein